MRDRTQLFLLLLLSAGHASGQNLILNPDFDSKLLHWNAFAHTGGSAELVDEDAGGDPDSRAVKATLPTGQSFVYAGAAQCVGGVVGGTTYDAGCRAFFSENLSSGAAILALRWDSASDCSGSELGSPGVTPSIDGSTAGFWTPSYATFTAPEGAQSVVVSLLLELQTFTGDSVLLDGAILAPQGSVPLPLLVNSFESGDFAGWVTPP